MKYVRTKYTIYEIDKDISFGGKEIYKVRNHDFSIIGNNLPKADNIKELIDGYYLDIDNRSFDKSYTFDDLYEALEERKSWLDYSNRKGLDYDIILYGFIKTDKGLIYVAKANDKGDLEYE